MGIVERKSRQKQALRERILDAARRIVMREGFAALSMRKIADAIEYSPATLYLHFASRDEIAQALCAEGYAQLLETFVPLAQIADPAERLKALGRAYVAFGVAHPETYRLIFMEDPSYTGAALGGAAAASGTAADAVDETVEITAAGAPASGTPAPASTVSGKANLAPAKADDDPGDAALTIMISALEELKAAGRLSASMDVAVWAEAFWATLHGIVALNLTCPVFPTAPLDTVVGVALDTWLGTQPAEQQGGARSARASKKSSLKRRRHRPWRRPANRPRSHLSHPRGRAKRPRSRRDPRPLNSPPMRMPIPPSKRTVNPSLSPPPSPKPRVRDNVQFRFISRHRASLSMSISASPAVSDEVATYVANRIGFIELERPKALNALSTGMIRAMHAALDQWRENPDVLAVVVRSQHPRAFCAGGDIRFLYESAQRGEHDARDTFFTEEYRLNDAIFTYPKPYIALMNGVVMGGGMGISQGAHRTGGLRVVTSSTKMAMPETRIGLFPDVGASLVSGAHTGRARPLSGGHGRNDRRSRRTLRRSRRCLYRRRGIARASRYIAFRTVRTWRRRGGVHRA